MGDHGDIKHLARLLGSGVELEANTLCWMTDSTPHESLPLRKGTHRSFFRLVTSQVSVWFADHSTPNPLTPLPSHVRVIHGNKFMVSQQIERAEPTVAMKELALRTGELTDTVTHSTQHTHFYFYF